MSEPKRRTVVCEIHGLRFDPELSSGCARCRRQGLTRARPRFLPLLLALLAFTLIAARLVTAIINDRRSPTAEIEVARTGEADPRISPTPYRGAIERVDQTLYPAGVVDFSLLARQAGQHGDAVASALDNDGFGDAADAVRAFAADLGSSELDTRGLDTARDRWYRLKQNFFLPATWMDAPIEAPADDPALASAFSNFADELDVLLTAAASGIDEGWVERLDELELSRPDAPPFDAPSALLLANRALSESLTAARGAANRSAPDMPDDAASELEAARIALDTANGHLGDFGR